MTNNLIFVVGPTAIGKSDFAINLSKKINGSIINADSMQVYKELKILTARPNSIQTREIKHFLYGHKSGNERYNVAKWCNEVKIKIKQLHKKNITPIIVGGTGLYIDKLINGLANIPDIPELLKVESEKIIIEKGLEKFYEIVKKIDPHSTNNIKPNDKNRLKRIWEVYNFTGKKLSQLIVEGNNFYLNKNINYKILLFLPNREKNYNKVNERFVEMLNQGAIEEVEKLLDLKFKLSLPIMKAHGVPEISSFLENKITRSECVALGQQVTRNYVKRQNTWWKSSNLKIFQKFNNFPNKIDINAIKLDLI